MPVETIPGMVCVLGVGGMKENDWWGEFKYDTFSTL
jgi:hypothetical protein